MGQSFPLAHRSANQDVAIHRTSTPTDLSPLLLRLSSSGLPRSAAAAAAGVHVHAPQPGPGQASCWPCWRTPSPTLCHSLSPSRTPTRTRVVALEPPLEPRCSALGLPDCLSSGLLLVGLALRSGNRNHWRRCASCPPNTDPTCWLRLKALSSFNGPLVSMTEAMRVCCLVRVTPRLDSVISNTSNPATALGINHYAAAAATTKQSTSYRTSGPRPLQIPPPTRRTLRTVETGFFPASRGPAQGTSTRLRSPLGLTGILHKRSPSYPLGPAAHRRRLQSSASLLRSPESNVSTSASSDFDCCCALVATELVFARSPIPAALFARILLLFGPYFATGYPYSFLTLGPVLLLQLLQRNLYSAPDWVRLDWRQSTHLASTVPTRYSRTDSQPQEYLAEYILQLVQCGAVRCGQALSNARPHL